MQPRPRHRETRRIEALGPELLGFLRKRVGSEAEEVAQDVWLRVTAAAPDIEEDAGFRAYVFVVARRLLIDRHRRARPPLVALDQEIPVHPSAHGRVSAMQMAAVVQRTLDGIKPELAEVFVFRTRDGLPFKDIAAHQGCSVNTALGRMHQATRHVRRALEQEGLA